MQAFLRVALSKESSDFQAVALTPGVALLDSGTSGSLSALRRWLGRFAAESQWQGDNVEFFVGDGKGGRMEVDTVRLVTPSRLKGAMKSEYEQLLACAKSAVPSGSGERATAQWLNKAFEGNSPPGINGDGGFLYEYKDAAGNWRLIWVWGIRCNRRDGTLPMVCGKSACRTLFVPPISGAPRCGACGYMPLGRRLFRPRYLAALLLLLLLGGAATAYMQLRPTSRIEGLVLRATDKNPVPGAEITIQGTEDKVAVDAGGRFAMGPYHQGDVTLRVTAPGCEPQELPVTLARHQTEKLDIRLDRLGVPQGRVYAKRTRQPLADAEVRLQGATKYAIVTAGNGEFKFANYEEDNAQVVVMAKGYQTKTVEWTRKKGPLEIQLSGTSLIEGLVRDDNQLPIAGAKVTLDGFADEVATGADGRFCFVDLPGETEQTLAVQAIGYPPIQQNVTLAGKGETPVEIVIAGKAGCVGRVVDLTTGDPILDATISLEGSPARTRTDDQGTFQFAGLRSAQYPLLCEAKGYTPLRETYTIGEQSTDDLTLSMTGAGALTVEVIDPNQNDLPVADATVAVVIDDKPVRQGRTAANGSIAFTPIPSDNAHIVVGVPGYGEVTLPYTIAPDVPSVCRVELRGDDELVGSVQDATTRKPLTDAKVTLRFPNASTKDIPLDAAGGFRLSGLMSGTYALEASAAGYPATATTEITLPEDRSDVVLKLEGAGSCGGKVVDARSGDPIAGVRVSLDDGLVEDTTDADGRFRFADLREKGWALSATADGYQSVVLQNQLAAPQAEPLSIPMSGSGDLAVRVVDPFAGSAPMSGVRVTVSRDGAVIASGPTNEAGVLAVRPIRSGPVSIQADSPTFATTGHNAATVPFDILENGPSQCNIALTGARSIDVMIQDAMSKRAVAGADVAVFDASTVTSTSPIGQKVDQGKTDALGRYKLDNLTAGEYAVVARAPDLGYGVSSPRKVTAAAGGPPAVLPLEGISGIRGNVVYADGSPARGAQVQCSVTGRTETTDANGQFAFSKMPFGTYRIAASASNARSESRTCPLSASDVAVVDPPLVLERSFQFTGTLVDAIHNKPISSAAIEVDGVTLAYTDSQGNFTIDDMPEGDQQVTIKARNYDNETVTIDAAQNPTIHTALSPSLGKNMARIVLLWGNRPADLDAHLMRRKNNGSAVDLHVYYKDHQRDNEDESDAILDVDAIKGKGPETITIKNLQPGAIYDYYVHHDRRPDNPGSFATSEAEVRVYWKGADGETQKARLPVQPDGTNDLWKVLQLRAGPNDSIEVTKPGTNQYFQVGTDRQWHYKQFP